MSNRNFSERRDLVLMAVADYIVITLLLLMGWVCLIIAGPAEASSLDISLGQNYGKEIGPGIWQQEGLDNSIDQGKPSVSIKYVGNTNLSWLDYGVALAYRESPVASGEFVSDDCFNARQFSGGHMTNNGRACDRRWYAKVGQKTLALQLTVVPTWHINRNTSLALGFGYSIFHSVLKMEWEPRGVCAPVACENSKYRTTDATKYADLTFKYKNAFVTVYGAEDESAPETLSSTNYGWLVGYSVGL